MEEFRLFLDKNSIEYLENFDLSQVSSIKLGEKAKLVIYPKNISELKKTATTAMKIAQSTEKSGAEKKEYVIKNVETISEASNVELTEEDWIEISEFIDNMKDFYNQMKKNDKK